MGPRSVAEEIAEAKRTFPGVLVATATDSFMQCSYKRSPYTRVRLTLSFPDGYPDGHQLIVSVVADDIVPVGLKRKLEGDFNQIAVDNKNKGYTQIQHIFRHLTTFINENMFVPCWRELKQCVSLVKTSNENASSTKLSTISIYERQGKIRLGIVASKYHYNCSITVDPAYPDFSPANSGKACLLKVIATNFSTNPAC